MMKKNQGFSLVELIIVVALIGIVTVFGFGYYGDNVISANRTEGRSALSETAGALEKCRSLYGTYNAANCQVTFPVQSASNLYSVTVTAMDGESFTLQADPVAGGSQANDAECTQMSLTNTGLKTGTGADPTQCW